MDEHDRKILRLLRENSRLTYTKIAQTMGLSEGTVRQRIRRLLQSGVIRRFTIETMDEKPEALVMVSTSSTFSTSKIAEQLLRIMGVTSISELAGQYDISVIVSGEDVASVNQSIDEIRSIEGIQNTHTLFVLRKWR